MNVSATASAAKEQHHEAGTSAPLAAPARPAVTCPVVTLPEMTICGAPADLIGEAFCEHEHRRHGPICSPCSTTAVETSHCDTCWHLSTEPHKCRLQAFVFTRHVA